MQHQKMQIHGAGRAGSGSGSFGHGRNGTTSLANNTSNSLHRFSVDALAGTGNTNSKKSHLLNVTSDEENSVASWDEADDDDDEDDDIDVGPLSPTAVSTTSESSRGGSSPSINRSTK